MSFFRPTYFVRPSSSLRNDWPLLMDSDDIDTDTDSLLEPFLVPYLLSERAKRSRSKPRPRDWTQVLDMRRFSPSEIHVQEEGNKVRVWGRHEEVDGENQDSFETKRVLNIPEDVDREKLSVRVTEGRSVVVTAPYLKKEEEQQGGAGDSLIPRLPSTEYEIVDKEDGKKEFQLKLHMADFTDTELSVRTSDNTVYIDGEKEWEHEGMKGMQRIHRQFAVPGVGEMGEARAVKDDSGLLTVRIPLKCVTQTRVQTIPIEQQEAKEEEEGGEGEQQQK